MCMYVAIILIQNTMQNNIFFERVPKNEPKYKAANTYTGGIGGVKYNNYNINSKRNRKYRTYTRETVNDKFFAEYCNEVDIFDSQNHFPDWIYEFREQNLRKISKNFRLMCQILKDEGFEFKIKYPIESENKWKFADAYLPKYNLVVLLLSDKDFIGLPCWSKSNKELFFEKKCSVIAILPDELPKLHEKLQSFN